MIQDFIKLFVTVAIPCSIHSTLEPWSTPEAPKRYYINRRMKPSADERRPDGEGPRRPGGGEIARRRGAGVTGRRIMKVMRGAPRSVSGSCLRDLETGTVFEKLPVHANRIHTSRGRAEKHNAVAAWQPHRPTRGRGSNSATATAATRSASYARCAGPTLLHASSASA